MTVYYEWDVETIAVGETDKYEDGEVLDHHHCDTYAEAMEFAASEPDPGTRYVITLVRDDTDGRSWAYIEDGELPEFFEDAYYFPVAKVPQRFVKELK